jgi:predicted Zn-dependent protease
MARMRRAPVLATVLAVLWSCGASAQVGRLDPFAQYDVLVNRYRHGQHVEAVQELGTWPADDVLSAVQQGLAREWDKLPAAVLLHTESALRDLASGSMSAYELNVSIALAQARALLRTPRGKHFGPHWFLVVGLLNTQVAGAISWLNAGLKVYPDDPELLLALGSFEETSLTSGSGGLDMGSSEVARRSQAAEFHLRRALKLDDNLHEARVRLARMLIAHDNDEAALRELDVVLSRSPAPDVLYLARLFLGRIREHEGRVAEAAEAYAAAVAIDDRCQTAQVALSAVRWRLGDTRAAADAVRRAVVPSETGCLDPWWLYPWAQRGHIDALLEELRKEVAA